MNTSLKLGVIAAVAAAFAAANSPAVAAPTVLKLGHNAATNHHYHALAMKYKEAVEKASNGSLEITVFPNDQLGAQRQLVEGTQLGTTDMVITSDSVISNFVPEFGALNMPFLFRDMEHVAKTMDGEIGASLSKLAEAKGIVVLGYWENGFRAISNSKKPLNTAEDLKGLKIRISPGPIAVATFEAFGAMPAPMATGEVYSALQLGTVDGQENSPTFVLSQKYYEVQKYLTFTRHQHNVEPLIISKIVFDGLTADQQKILLDEAVKLAPEARQVVEDLEKDLVKQLEGKIAVNDVADPESFRTVAQKVYDQYKDQYGDLIAKIVAVK